MPFPIATHLFGHSLNCASLAEILALVANNAMGRQRVLAAAHGMAIHGRQAVCASHSFEDTRHVLDELSRAKAALDIAAWHDPEVVSVTEAILEAARRHVRDETIGCHEWPYPGEVAEVAIRAAERIAVDARSI